MTGDPLGLLGNFEKKPKKMESDPLVSSGFANTRKGFWLKQGLEPATA